ncbi:MAG: ribosome silencing factor [Cytophagia bacterium]|nr:MAG: ribosome silencing factor [Cytophagales bacterium]TAG01257.1 MAG: ribosome silencing factor [Cytophagia bacterium]TAG38924.1 MAG: ribosome silencing factor [Cytophagia bacterium]TAH28159.1 MAG: ribosome silencing factor [Cytophagales bacterium]
MKVIKKQATGQQLTKLIAKGMLDKKAKDIKIMDLRKVPQAIADFFVICSGSSAPQVDAITDSIEDVVHRETGENPRHKEGKTNKEWILLDYIDVVVHIFKQEKRDYYSIEELWGDAKITSIADED